MGHGGFRPLCPLESTTVHESIKLNPKTVSYKKLKLVYYECVLYIIFIIICNIH